MIDDRYVVERFLDKSSGEADILVCKTKEQRPRTVVVKLYRRHLDPDSKVLDKLKGLLHEDLIALLDYGHWLGFFYEVMEYAQGGSLADRADERAYTEEELTKRVIPEVLNALNACHTRGIVHRDVKESNLYYRDAAKTDIVLADFGISSVVGEYGEARYTKREGFTLEYAAPECFLKTNLAGGMVVNPALDYYSFGITLLKLLGFHPYLGLPQEALVSSKIYRSTPLPPSASPRFRNLLRGLLHRDPEHRAGYEEVRRWLRGEELTIAPEPELASARQEVRLFGQVVSTPREVGSLLLEHPEEGQGDIERQQLPRQLEVLDGDVARRVYNIAEKQASSRCKLIEAAFFLNPDQKYPLLPNVAVAAPENLPAVVDGSAEAWRAASTQLANGELTAWLQGLGRGDLEQKWREVESTARGTGDADTALEVFLKVLKPDLARPGLRCVPSPLSLTGITAEGRLDAGVTVTNPGRGCLDGVVALQPEIPGVRLTTTTVKAHRALKIEQKIGLEIDVDRLERGRAYRSALVFTTNHVAVVKVTVALRRVFPVAGVLRYAGWGALAGAAIMGGTRWLIAFVCPRPLPQSYDQYRTLKTAGRGFDFGQELLFVLALCFLIAVPILLNRLLARKGG